MMNRHKEEGTNLESLIVAYSEMSMLKEATIFFPLGPSYAEMGTMSERHGNHTTRQTHSHCTAT